MAEFLMIAGFLLAAYSIVANDSIQTLGTFLASNAKRPWWIKWIFASSILIAAILGGYFFKQDITWERLDRFPEVIAEIPTDPDTGEQITKKTDGMTGKTTELIEIQWYFIIPPIILLFLTRFGFPVSTSFLVLTVFTTSNLGGMITKSLMGYAVAMVVGILVYLSVMNATEKKWAADPEKGKTSLWMTLQWISTGWLWFNWLRQDLANIFVYLPRGEDLPITWLIGAIVAMVIMQGFIFFNAGGAIQKVVTQKSNTSDIRSATIIDFLYGTVLWFFKELNNLPMSTTWVFLGLLAGRELGIAFRNSKEVGGIKNAFQMMGIDAAKAGTGLIISVIIALGVNFFAAS